MTKENGQTRIPNYLRVGIKRLLHKKSRPISLGRLFYFYAIFSLVLKVLSNSIVVLVFPLSNIAPILIINAD